MFQPGQERSLQLDALRGFAVLGIFWIGVGAFGMPYGANALPTLLGKASTLNLAIWASTDVFMEGAMRGLFSMLFGASALMLLDQDRSGSLGVEQVDRFYRRNLLLMLFGMIHAYLLLWPHDVLFAYGLLGMFLFPMRRMSALTLFVAGFILHALTDVEVDWVGLFEGNGSLASLLGQAVSPGPVPGRDDRFLDWMRAQMAQDIQIYRSGYIDIFLHQLPQVVEQESIAMYKRHVFQIGGMMMMGMALLRWGVFTGQRSTRFYLLLMIFGYLVGSWMRGAGVYHAFAYGFDPAMLLQMERVDYDIGRLPMALGHVGLVGLLCRSAALTWLVRPLAATGRLALTHYLTQTAIAITLFYGFGFGLFAQLERSQLMLVCLAVWVFQIGFSLLWLSRYRNGPLEWLWRCMIYRQWQPLRIRAA